MRKYVVKVLLCISVWCKRLAVTSGLERDERNYPAAVRHGETAIGNQVLNTLARSLILSSFSARVADQVVKEKSINDRDGRARASMPCRLVRYGRLLVDHNLDNHRRQD